MPPSAVMEKKACAAHLSERLFKGEANARITHAFAQNNIYSLDVLLACDENTLRSSLQLSMGDSNRLARALDCIEERIDDFEPPDTRLARYSVPLEADATASDSSAADVSNDLGVSPPLAHDLIISGARIIRRASFDGGVERRLLRALARAAALRPLEHDARVHANEWHILNALLEKEEAEKTCETSSAAKVEKKGVGTPTTSDTAKDDGERSGATPEERGE